MLFRLPFHAKRCLSSSLKYYQETSTSTYTYWIFSKYDMWCFFKKHYSKYFIMHFIMILYFPYILILLKKYICKIAELQLIFFFFANLQFLFFKVNVNNNMKKITTLQFFFNVKSIKRGLGHHFIQKNVGVVNLSPYNPTIWSIYVYSATENSFLYHIGVIIILDY